MRDAELTAIYEAIRPNMWRTAVDRHMAGLRAIASAARAEGAAEAFSTAFNMARDRAALARIGPLENSAETELTILANSFADLAAIRSRSAAGEQRVDK